MSAGGSNRSGIADTAESISDGLALDVTARFGFAVLGVVHILIGVIALQVASGGDGQAEPTGALEQLASGSAGPWTMWACAIGCLGLALWQLSESTLRYRRKPVGKRLEKAVSSGSLAVTYGIMAVTMARFALGDGPDSSEFTRDFTRTMMAYPLGSFIVLVVGGTVLGIGVYFIVKGLRRTFRPELEHFVDLRRGAVVDALGVLGHVAKGVALILMGLLFVVAAITNQPSQSTGLDGSLKALQDHPFGNGILIAIAVGLIFYGAFAIIRARFGRM
ncbi:MULTISPECIES: DUF1206 domain-containing protein [unclassified Arthrobacter]|uniref:DUF1206 domain-containing protein n=1 Tax=unclassified Arthrobacter TaxID=235627 RepID=UPI000466525E|nr:MULTISPECIES: DUF1206 domain-containing protein [unclassified Arthrobacter]PVE19634.1 DUF1206 domain-containing protein [Arthrobacter sp. Bz4]